MDDAFPASWAALKHPWTRRDLLANLEEISSKEILDVWSEQRLKGLVVGFDEVVHFFFDDHDFDTGDVGFALFDEGEVRLISAVKEPLNAICADLPEGDDTQSVQHFAWGEVREAAARALFAMRGQ